jgi:hypothetical protein
MLENPGKHCFECISFRMSMGKVDKLGRFVSELDPQPEIEKTKSRRA